MPKRPGTSGQGLFLGDNTPYGDLLEEGIGYLLGLVFLGIGFWRWIPAVIALRAEEAALRASQEGLKRRIIELTGESNKLQNLLECSHASAHVAGIQPENRGGNVPHQKI